VIDLRIIRPISAIVVLFMAVQSATLTAMVWPTPHSAPASGEGFETWAQATVSGDPASALFGCVRNDGRRFHEGIDIAPYHRRDRRGEATDPVVAAFTGTVAYVNTTAGDSSYGRYVIMEHPQFSPAVYTLYAHLAAVDASIEKGRVIDAGTRLGTMGRSAGGYTIPRDRAHLHFEIGLQLTERFQEWYDRQRYGSRNQHGNYSGLNLVGFDPLECYNWLRAHPQQTVSDYFATIPPGLIVEVVTSKIPDFVRRYPDLMPGGVPETVAGWRVSISGFGVPLRLEPLWTVSEGAAAGEAVVVAIDPEQLDRFSCRSMVNQQANGTATLGSGGRQLMELLFDFK